MMKKTILRKQILSPGFALCSMLLPLKAQASTNFSQIVVFGDSLSDTGSTFKATGFPPSPPYFEGRASNGSLWVDYLAEDLGLSSACRTNYAFPTESTSGLNVFVLATLGTTVGTTISLSKRGR